VTALFSLTTTHSCSYGEPFDATPHSLNRIGGVLPFYWIVVVVISFVPPSRESFPTFLVFRQRRCFFFAPLQNWNEHDFLFLPKEASFSIPVNDGGEAGTLLLVARLPSRNAPSAMFF